MTAPDMYVKSSLPDASEEMILVPEPFRACGMLGELAQGEAGTPVSLPFSEHALRAWAQGWLPTHSSADTCSNDVCKTGVEILEVRLHDRLVLGRDQPTRLCEG